MGKTEKFIFLLFGLVLLFLFFLSSTDLILKVQKDEIFRISVIVDEVDDGYWVNYKKGMEQAAKKWNVDISFVTLYVDQLEQSQLDLIKREIENGTQAIIVSPVNHQQLEEMLQKSAIGIPIIALKERINSDKITASLEVDLYGMGKKLAETMVQDQKGKIAEILAITHKDNESSAMNYYEGMNDTLKTKAYNTTFLTWRTTLELEKILLNEDKVFVGMDAITLENILEIYNANEKVDFVLYGNGYSSKILRNLDYKSIKAITISDDFNMGYVSVHMAVRALNNEMTDTTVAIPDYCIQAEKMYDKEYEMILFPIS